MKTEFFKYHGTGNDFVIIDDRAGQLELSQTKIARICHRRFGIGADGLMLLRNHSRFDFEMVYYNSDGKTSSMCGNGGRCLVAFAHRIGVFTERALFTAIDGAHTAHVHTDGRISLFMNNIETLNPVMGDWVLDTGSPHYLKFVQGHDLMRQTSFLSDAANIRYSTPFKDLGINVNFIELLDTTRLKMRTYERGVEDETYSCGTGAVAAAIGAHAEQKLRDGNFLVDIQTMGGLLQVRFEYLNKKYQHVELIGPAKLVYIGEIETEES